MMRILKSQSRGIARSGQQVYLSDDVFGEVLATLREAQAFSGLALYLEREGWLVNPHRLAFVHNSHLYTLLSSRTMVVYGSVAKTRTVHTSAAASVTWIETEYVPVLPQVVFAPPPAKKKTRQ